MSINSTPIQATTFFRQEERPTGAPDGAVWVNPSDGAGGGTVGRYTYKAEADEFRLTSAVGPDRPDSGVIPPGATWRDTSTGQGKQFDGSQFVSVGKSDAQIQAEALATDIVLGGGL